MINYNAIYSKHLIITTKTKTKKKILLLEWLLITLAVFSEAFLVFIKALLLSTFILFGGCFSFKALLLLLGVVLAENKSSATMLLLWLVVVVVVVEILSAELDGGGGDDDNEDSN